MLITRKSIFSGKERTLDLPITQEELNNWRNGMVIQRAMPQLTVAEREFIQTGMTPDEWNTLFQEKGE